MVYIVLDDDEARDLVKHLDDEWSKWMHSVLIEIHNQIEADLIEKAKGNENDISQS